MRPLLEMGVCTALLGEVATQFARGQIPDEILPGIRSSRMTPLQKPDGGVQVIVVGDVFRRLGRTLANQCAPEAQAATQLFYSPPVWRQKAWRALCKRLPVCTPVRRFCQKMASVIPTPDGVVPRSPGRGEWREAGSTCQATTANRRTISKMQWVMFATYVVEKAQSSVTLSCRFFLFGAAPVDGVCVGGSSSG